jgi:hypothetical protein
MSVLFAINCLFVSRFDGFIPLNETAYDVISGLERKGDYIFSRLDGLKRDKHFICRSFKNCLRKAGLGEGYSFPPPEAYFCLPTGPKGHFAVYIESWRIGIMVPRSFRTYSHKELSVLNDLRSLLGPPISRPLRYTPTLRLRSSTMLSICFIWMEIVAKRRRKSFQ